MRCHACRRHGWCAKPKPRRHHPLRERHRELRKPDALLVLAQRAGLAVRRLSLRRTEPNFQLHVSLPDRRQPARDFFEAG